MLYHATNCTMQINIEVMLTDKRKGREHISYINIYVQIHAKLITVYLHVH